MVRTIFTLIATTGCLMLLTVSIEPARFWTIVRNLSIPWLCAGMVALAGFYYLRAARWRAVLLGRVSRVDAFAMSSVGYLVSTALPFSGGEFAKLGLLRHRTGIGYAAGIATLVLERLLDVMMILLVGVVGLAWAATTGELGFLQAFFDAVQAWAATLPPSASLGPIVVIPCLAVPIVASWRSELGRRLRRRVAVHPQVASVLVTLAPMRSPQVACPVIAFTLSAWGLNMLSLWLTIRALGFEVTGWELTLGFSVVTIGLLLPLAPGYVGQYELTWAAVFGLIGSTPEIGSIHTALIVHALILATIGILGAAATVPLLGWESNSRTLADSIQMVRRLVAASHPAHCE